MCKNYATDVHIINVFHITTPILCNQNHANDINFLFLLLVYVKCTVKVMISVLLSKRIFCYFLFESSVKSFLDERQIAM